MAHVFVMEWAAILRDLVIGLLIAGAIAAWVPAHFWRVFFITGHPVAAALWGPLVGPLVSLLSFVCSIGNVPLAAVLWKDGLSFGGVTSFIFADLLILPILNIYRKYYGAKMAAVLLGTFYAAMVMAGYAVEGIFAGLGITPARSGATIPDSGVTWNYTTWLNIVFLLVAAVLLVRFARTGGMAMLRMMGGPADADHSAHAHGAHDHGAQMTTALMTTALMTTAPTATPRMTTARTTDAAHDHAAHDHGGHDHGGHDHAAHDHPAGTGS